MKQEPGSFRDPDSRVVRAGSRVFRLLSPRGLDDWRALAASPLFEQLIRERKLVPTREVDDAPELDGDLYGGVAGALEHELVPFVSYPYEWTFAMLRDAALLQLELVRRAIDVGLMLKDATPYNVQFRGAEPVFVDVGSFEPLREGEPWAAYRQFCSMFLYPLLLEAWRGVPFQPWLRGSLEGITPTDIRNLLSPRDRFRRGALTHVVLHSRLERRYEDTSRDVRAELKSAGFRKELIVANVRGLERLVSRLRPSRARSAWSAYRLTTTYSPEDAARKAAFVAAAVDAERPQLVWDVGCNEGRHARAAADVADYVVAFDADDVVVDRFYSELRREKRQNVLPLAVDVVDPSPARGWRGQERRTLVERGAPDLVLCLALLHHVSIGANVPIAAFVEWLADLTPAAVVEFPTPDDPMVKRLLARKRENDHSDYRRDHFERCLREHFDVVDSLELANGCRVLYRARARR